MHDVSQIVVQVGQDMSLHFEDVDIVVRQPTLMQFVYLGVHMFICQVKINLTCFGTFDQLGTFLITLYVTF